MLDLVLETSKDLDSLRFKWSELTLDMGNDGLSSSNLSEEALNGHMEFLSSTLPRLTKLTLALFPSPMVVSLLLLSHSLIPTSRTSVLSKA